VAENRYLSTGNEAIGEGAVRAGCRFYAGYPITPQNELTAYMSVRMEQEQGVFIQSESELAAINMVLGASAAGARAMTSSSSPGISLKLEGISYIAGCEVPAVIVNVMRGGPGLGNISAAQGDYFQATKGGGHGDYRCLVLAPSTVQEAFDLSFDAFGLADKYRMPVMVLADGMLGQMMEPLKIEDGLKPEPEYDKDWALKGARGRAGKSVKSLLLGERALEDHNIKLQEKYALISRQETRAESYMTGNADIILVAYGIVSRTAREVVDRLREDGIRAGMFRPVTLWPFPGELLKNEVRGGRKVLVAEMSAGQMYEDVRLSLGDDERTFFYGRMGGGFPSADELINKTKEILTSE
jgi:2-oxoglutarate ferredoxin oxidoreductase subunit alpha